MSSGLRSRAGHDTRELLLGLDIGTSSSKGVLVQSDGRIVATAERAHAVSRPRPGWAEHDPEAVWWADTIAICRALTARSLGPIAGVCVSGIGPCVLPTDAKDRPLRPAILYGIDSRATGEITELTERYGAERILQRGGSALSSQAAGPKLLWLKRHEPEVWARTRRFYMASSFIVNRLTGAYILDHHSASQCDPLYDIGLESWAADWVAEIVPELELPSLLWSAEIAGYLTAEAAQATGIPRGTPVNAGTIDAWSEALSVGVQEPGDVMLMYGTTMFIIEVLPALRPSEGMWGTTGLYPGSRTIGAGTATSGALTGWLRAIAGDPPYEQLISEASSVPAGSEGLVALPYFAGERTPLFDPDARGLLLGLTLDHKRGHVYRALLEATGYAVHHILETLEAAGGSLQRFVAVGGGTRGNLWTQIISDVTGRSQELPTETIGAAYGNALLAAVGAGLVPANTKWATVKKVIDPSPNARSVYQEMYPIYRSLYPATVEQAHALAAIQARTAVPSRA